MKKVKEIFLPDLGEGIDSATISEISVSNEQTIKKDDIIIVLESEKASMEIPSEVDGIVKSINVENGQEIKTGELLLTIETENLKEKEVKKPTTNKEQVELKTTNHENINLKTKHLSDASGVYASPGVRRLARELNINLDIMSGSGNKGRITKEDLHGYIKAKMYAQKTPPTHLGSDVDFNQWGETDVKKLTKIKTITGSRLTRAWQTIPHVTQFIEAEVTSLDLLRKKEKEKLLKKDIKVTMMSFLMKAAVNTLKEYPIFNSSIQNNGTNIVFKKYYHIGIAVDTKDGLVVPVIKDVDKKNIEELSKELMVVSEKARNKKLSPKDLKGGTFTISNLGGIGGSFFTPIINPPEVAILGVSRMTPVNSKDKKLILPLSLSYDHRVVDGAAGAAFMVHLSSVLNNPDKIK